MVIKTMSDSSRLTEVSTPADKEFGEEPDLQPRALKEPQAVGAEDTGISDIIVSRGERGQLLERLLSSREDVIHFFTK